MYKEIIRPILDYLDTKSILPSEEAHSIVKRFFHAAESNPATLALFERVFVEGGRHFTDPRLQVNVGGVLLDNPLMVGAGWDKEGIAVRALHRLGFAAVEIGTVVKRPQKGNPKPRQFVLAPGVVLNRLGFNSPGMEAVARNLERYQGSGIPLGVNIGINKETDHADAPKEHAEVTECMYEHATYFTLNVSSPNTPNLRELQGRELLADNIQAVIEAMEKKGGRKPFFVKIAPDLTMTAVDDVITVAIDNRLAGIVAANTTISSDLKAKYGERWRNEPGGLSGDDEDFLQMSNRIITHIFRQAGGQMDIIGVGGVNNTRGAIGKILCGAKAVQIVTGLRGEGTTLPGKINREIVADWIERRKDVNNISGFIGNSTRSFSRNI